MYWELYGDIKSFQLLIFVWIKRANYVQKKLTTSLRQNESWQKHNIAWFDFVNLFGFKRFFRKIGTILELCDIKNGGCLRILVAARQR